MTRNRRFADTLIRSWVRSDLGLLDLIRSWVRLAIMVSV